MVVCLLSRDSHGDTGKLNHEETVRSPFLPEKVKYSSKCCNVRKFLGGEVRYHLGESTTPQTTLRPLPTSSFSKNQGEKVFTTQQYVKTYSQVLRDRKKQPSQTNQGLLTTYYDVLSR